MLKKLLPFFLGSVLVGCAVPPGFPSQAELYDDPWDYERFGVFSDRGEVIGAHVDQGGMLGFAVNIGRYNDPDDHALRGHVHGRLVNARVDGDYVEGHVGRLPFRMIVERDDDAVAGRGLVYGRPFAISMTEDRAIARIDRCRLDLRRRVPRSSAARYPIYVGRRRCGGQDVERGIVLQMGRSLPTWSDSERLAALSLMLFRD